MKREPIDTGGERDVDALLRAQVERIDQLRELCGELIASCSPSIHAASCDFDDIFLLRYILSFGSPELAFPAVKAAVEFRSENEPWLGPAMRGEGLDSAPNRPQFVQVMAVAQHSDKHTKDGRNIIHLIRSGVSSPTEAIKKLGAEGVTNHITFVNEHYFRICDKETRATRRLVKVLGVNDLTGANLLGMDVRFGKALGASSKRGEFLHPQLIYKTVMFNPPIVFKAVFATFKPFLSQGFVEKMNVCPAPRGAWKGDLTKCLFALKHFERDALPTYLGGECACEGSCVPGWENELSK